jgi:hypothetical protein
MFCVVNWLTKWLFQPEAPRDGDGNGATVRATTEVEPSSVEETGKAQTQVGALLEDAKAVVETEKLRCEGVEFSVFELMFCKDILAHLRHRIFREMEQDFLWISFEILMFVSLHLFTWIIWFFFEGWSMMAHGWSSCPCQRGGAASGLGTLVQEEKTRQWGFTENQHSARSMLR